MEINRIKYFALIIISALFLVACNSGPIQPTPTLPRLYTPTVTDTPTIAPSLTPVPSETPTLFVYPQNPKSWKYNISPVIPNDSSIVVLENWQKNFAVNTVRDFFANLYNSDTLVPVDNIAKDFDVNSKIWTGDAKTKMVGINDIYSNLENNKIYISFEFPITDNEHYTNWLIYGLKDKSNDLKIMALFTVEPQTYTYKNISDNQMAAGTGVMSNNRKMYAFELSFLQNAWKISNMVITNID